MSSSGEQYVPGFDNRGTMVVSKGHPLLRTPVDVARLWGRIWDPIYEGFAQGRGRGYALVLLDDGGEIQATASLTAGRNALPNTVTVGRHTHCGLHVIGDPMVALRHLLVSVHAPDGEESTPLLEVSDLRTEKGFVVEGVGSVRAALVRGATNLAFASMRLLALPLSGAKSWPIFPHHAWECFFAEPAVLVQPALLENPAAEQEPSFRGTRVSVVQPPVEVSELVDSRLWSEESLPIRPRPAQVEQGRSGWSRETEGPQEPLQLDLGFMSSAERTDFDDFDDSNEDGSASESGAASDPDDNVVYFSAWECEPGQRPVPLVRVRLSGPGGRVWMTLSDRDLHRGVVLGRYERCAGHVKGHVFDDSVSRVHALLRSDGHGRILVIDTGSTHGIRLDSRGPERVRCEELRPGDRAWLSYASHVSVEDIQ